MIRTEAIHILDNLKPTNTKSSFDAYVVGNAITMAIKALQQEPCDDAVSRQAVLDLVADYDLSMGQVVKGIHALPSVTSQQKMGQWIEDTNGTYTDNHDTWECSECGHAQILLEGTPIDNDYNYCPNCGAKMSEIPTDSEGSDIDWDEYNWLKTEKEEEE